MSKKRKLNDLLDGDGKQRIISHFRQVVTSETEIAVSDCGEWISVGLYGIGAQRLSTLQIRKSADQTGLELLDCVMVFGQKSKVELKLAAGAEMKLARKQFEEEPKVECLSSGQTPDEDMLNKLSEYATNYLGKQTPPAECIKIVVVDARSSKVWDKKETPPPRKFEMRISGWTTCSLTQLEAFQTMFPAHVGTVQIDDTTVYVPVQSYANPFRRSFRLL